MSAHAAQIENYGELEEGRSMVSSLENLQPQLDEGQHQVCIQCTEIKLRPGLQYWRWGRTYLQTARAHTHTRTHARTRVCIPSTTWYRWIRYFALQGRTEKKATVGSYFDSHGIDESDSSITSQPARDSPKGLDVYVSRKKFTLTPHPGLGLEP